MLALVAVAAGDPLPVVTHPPKERVRLVFLGDSGQVPRGARTEPCRARPDGSAGEACAITEEERRRLVESVRATEPDAVFGLGDLVYWRAPACQAPAGRDLAVLDAAIGSIYADLGAPSYLVLGNHDLAQRRRAPRRVRCLQAYAAATDGIELPGRQYTVDLGVARVVALDTNRARSLPTEAFRALLAEDRGWTIAAAHHDLRVAFDKDDPYSRAVDARPGAWLGEVGALPDLWVNGHAHLLQLGVYDPRVVDGGRAGGPDLGRLPALTSGAASKLRAAPSCGVPGASAEDRAACAAEDARGMPEFSMSRFGFAVVDLTATGMEVRLVDLDGRTLFTWTR